MGLFIVLQVLFDLGFLAWIIYYLVERVRQKTSEDAKLSRTFQLASGKISVLSDLMDRSEALGRQTCQLIDGKRRDLEECLERVDSHIAQLEKSIEKSETTAKLFQDRIPHEEVIERKMTLKYVEAAKLADQGLSPDEICRQIGLPRGEAELIAKLSRVSGASP